MKKVISILLVAVMLMSTMAFAVSAANEAAIPVIYICGKNNIGYYNTVEKRPTKDPGSIDRLGTIKEAILPVVEELAGAMITDNYDKYVDSLVESIAPIYEEIVLTKDGTAPATSIPYNSLDANGNPVLKQNYNAVSTGPRGEDFRPLKVHNFLYDWRLSCLEIAAELDKYIEAVCAKTGSSKVNIFGRCLGANVALAYVYETIDEENHPFRVKNLFLETPSNAGLISVGSLLSGSIVCEEDRVDQFMSYYVGTDGITKDEITDEFLAALVSVLNHATLLGMSADLVEDIINRIKDDLLPRLALACYGAYPSYWNMVGDEFYDKAVAQIFNTPELKKDYAVFIAKTDAYHNALGRVDKATGLAGYEKVILDAKNAFDMNTAIHAKYGRMTAPLFEGSDITGDTRATATELSFGATATLIDEKFSDEYIAEAKANGTDKYISADKTVDASTCLLPETTWFTKYLNHDAFIYEYHALAKRFFDSDGTITVSTDELSQFMDYKDGKLVQNTEPAKGEDDNSASVEKNPFVIFINFFRRLFDFLTKLFKK